MPHHIEDDDSVDSQPDHVTPDSQSRSLCTGSDTNRFESVDSDKKRNLIGWPSDEVCQQEHSKCG